MEAGVKYILDYPQKYALLRSLMLAWDGQWFLKVSERFGVDEAFVLNEAVGNTAKRLIARMSLKAWNKEHADDFCDAGHMIQGILDWTQGDFMSTRFEIDEGTIQIQVTHCQAYEGAKQANLKREDQACLNCKTMWPIWFEALLPGQKVNVSHLSRMSTGQQACLINIQKA